MLASYGIETAADIKKAKIMQIPGFGEALTSELVEWRKKHERNFRFNPNEPVDRHEIDAMDRDLESERQNLLTTLRQGSATGGLPTHSDTHPFSRELGGRDFCFAHNGTVPDFRDLSLSRYQPVGGTDSEHVFCHLLAKIAERGDLLNTESSWQWLHQQLGELNQHGKFNCLMSDGQRLFCYHDAAAWKGLNLRRVSIREGQERHFEDAGIAVDVKKDGEVQTVNYGYVIATCPLSKTGWTSFHPGELIVLEGGTVCFSPSFLTHPEDPLEPLP